MKNKLLLFLLLLIFSAGEVFSQTIDQKLHLQTNDNTVGGNFVVDVQVKGTSLSSANTLGSATIDVQFDNTKLTYQSADSWAFGGGEGYNRSATNNTTFIRIGITSFVSPSGGYSGFDIVNSSTTYTTWVRLHFLIAVGGTTSLTIASGSNQIGLYSTHSNSDESGTISDKTLSTPDVSEVTDAPTPVELNSFNAKTKGSDVELLWKTATEVNNHGFEVERKSNDVESSSWEKVGFVAGNGNSNSPKEYSFTDKNITGGPKFAYRLKQIDNSGTFTYSDKVEVEVVPDKFELFQNYPNPFNPSTTIKFSLTKDSRVAINIYNILGEKVTELINAEYKAGFYKVQLNSTGLGLASGIYFYSIETESFKSVKKMILMK